MIELDLAPELAARVTRVDAVRARRGARRPRSVPFSTTWHEHDDDRTEVVRDGARWRLERPLGRGAWAAGSLVIATADRPDLLGAGIAALPAPRARFSGRRRRIVLAPSADGLAGATLTVLDGLFTDGNREERSCRIRLEGADEHDLARLAEEIMVALGATPALAPLGRMPDGGEAAPPRLPAPAPNRTVDETLGLILGALGLTLLHWAPRAADGTDPHPVHQMRVAIRRLRSALLVFRDEIGGCLDDEREALRGLAARLGPARDWDVFLSATAPAIDDALPDGETLDALVAEAERARRRAYATLGDTLASPDTRRLLARLALLPFGRPWAGNGRIAAELNTEPDGGPDPGRNADAGAVLLETVAPDLVEKRFRRLTRKRPTLDGLLPEELHDARKAAKKLRYAIEFVSGTLPSRPSRKLLRRLGSLQDALGAINDTATGTTLLDDLPSAGAPAAPHARAAGIVIGWLAAEAAGRRSELDEIWSAIRRTDRFWRA